MTNREIKSYKLLDENFPPSPPIKDAKLYVLNQQTGKVETYITDKNGVPKALKDETSTGGGGDYTDEQAQDAVGNILQDSVNIDFTYNDSTPSIQATIKPSSVTETELSATVNTSLDLADSAVQNGDDVSFNSVQLEGGTGDQGKFSWNADEETVDLVQNGTILQLGQEVHIHVRNGSGTDIPDGTVVMARGTVGNSGRITVGAYDNISNVKYILGIATQDIAVGEDGKVTSFGKVRGIDTSSWNDGDILYTTANGGLTNIEPQTGLKNSIAFVIHSHTNGIIMVRVTPIDENYNDIIALLPQNQQDIENVYNTIAQMLSSQIQQTEGKLQKVLDDTDDPLGDGSRAYYLKTDSTTGTLADDYIRQDDDVAEALDAGQASETADCGSVIPMDNIYGHFCNMLSPNDNTSFTINNLNIIGSYTIVRINVSQADLDSASLTEPNISGATQQGGIEFIADTDLEMLVQNRGSLGLIYSYYGLGTFVGAGAVDSVNGQTGTVILNADDIDDTSTTNKFVTSADLTTLANTSGVNTGDQDISGITTNATNISTIQSQLTDFETTTELNARDTANRDRANHTGTQTVSTISDFDTEVSNNTSVVANTAKISADGSIDTHSDVDTSTVAPTDGQILVWDNTLSIWKPSDAPISGGLDLNSFLLGNEYAWYFYGGGISVVGTNNPTSVGTGSNVIGSSFSGGASSRWAYRQLSGTEVAFYEQSPAVTSVGSGFYFICQFWIASISGTDNVQFYGLTDSSSLIGNVDPSGLTNLLGIATDGTDTNLQFIHNDGTGTSTKIDLGANFSKSSGLVLQLEIKNDLNSSEIDYRVQNLEEVGDTGWVTVSSDLPTVNDALYPQFYMNIGIGSGTNILRFNYLKIYRIT